MDMEILVTTVQTMQTRIKSILMTMIMEMLVITVPTFPIPLNLLETLQNVDVPRDMRNVMEILLSIVKSTSSTIQTTAESVVNLVIMVKFVTIDRAERSFVWDLTRNATDWQT